MTAAYTDVLVVGAGHAGVHVAVGLATAPGAPTVRLVGAEPGLPYERPPLTKRLLYGEGDPSAVPLRTAAYWERSPVVLQTGDPVVAVDPLARVALTESGAALPYGRLVWAAGGRAAAGGLPGEQLRGVHSVRTLADLRGLRADLATARTAVVVGGGYLGLEAAAGLRRLALAVTVVELAPRLLARVTGPLVSEFFTQLHRGAGVDVRLGVGVERVLGDAGRVSGVLLLDGSRLDADVVLVGVGMHPEVGALLAAGARGDLGGVDVDQACLTSLDGVSAIGDCARQANPWSPTGAALRVESVHNASQHAAAVVRELSGLPAVAPAPPRFWSTQYDRELRTVGMPAAGDEQVLRGGLDAPFSVLYLRDGRLVAADTVDRPRDFARAQALVAAQWRPSRADLDAPELPGVAAVGRAAPVGSPA